MIEQEVQNKIESIKNKAVNIINNTKLYSYKGTVSKLLGLTVEVKLPGLKSAICVI